MKTTIYIDGYNFYYSRLKGTPYKWLDVVDLFYKQICLSIAPTSELVTLKYFTASVKASYARHGQDSEHAQTQYLRALQAKYPERLEVIQGFHIFEPTRLPSYAPGTPPSKAVMSPVWMIEEKQTDVNIALHAYRDAMQGLAQQLVICSNDSDLEPSLRFIGQDTPNVQIGLVMPLRDGASSEGKISNKRLTGLAHWVRHAIRDDELQRAQLSQHVSTRKKTASKPPHW